MYAEACAVADEEGSALRAEASAVAVEEGLALRTEASDVPKGSGLVLLDGDRLELSWGQAARASCQKALAVG